MSDFSADHRWMFTAEELAQTPSIRDGMPPAQEKLMRQKTCLFIVEMARLLKRNELVLHAACCIFQRFFAVQSFAKHSRLIVGAACLFLAAKIEESPVSLDNVVDVYLYIRRDKIEKSELSREMKEVREKILVAERIVLQTIGFDLHISHPIGNCLEYLRALKTAIPNDAKRQLVRQLAMNIVTDSFGSTLCLTQSARVIAAAAALLAIIEADLPAPSAANVGASAAMGGGGGMGRRPFGESNASRQQQSWLDLILSTTKVEENALKNTCFQMIEMYEERVIPVPEDEKAGESAGNGSAATNSIITSTSVARLRINFVKDVALGNQSKGPDTDGEAPKVDTAADNASQARSQPAPPPPPLRGEGLSGPANRSTAPVVYAAAPAVTISNAPPSVSSVMVPPTPEYMPPPPTPDLVPPPTPDLVPPPDMPLGPPPPGRVGSNGAPPPPPPPPRVNSATRLPPPPPPPSLSSNNQTNDISRKRSAQSIEGEVVTSLTTTEKLGQDNFPPAKKSAAPIA